MKGVAVAGFAALFALSVTRGVGAHALLRESDPPDGAMLLQAPGRVVLTFTEEPEAALSVVRVVDSSGQDVRTGPAQPVAGQPLMLQLPLTPLPQGTYTVTWRTVSRVDGHVTGGAFAFGIGIAPVGATPQPATPSPSILDVASRWIFYVGLSVLVGAAWVWSVAFSAVPTAGLQTLVLGWTTAIVGLAALAGAQTADAGTTLGQLLSTTVGGGLFLRALALLLTGAALWIALRLSGPRQRGALLAVAGIACAAIFVHVTAGHAGASQGVWRWPKVIIQWAHMSAAAVWLGGLAALLVGLRTSPRDVQTRAVKRFSAVAGVALVVVIVTGTARAIDQVGAWTLLITTAFGRLVLLKTALLLALAALGAVNRYRHVPAVPRSLPGLRRVGTTEVVIALVVFGATGYLTSLAPASLLAATASPPPLITTGNDYGTTVRARLEVSPGIPGMNTFTLRIADYDSGQPINAQRVTLRFSPAGRSDIGPSTLLLTASRDGVFTGRGSNLSIAVRWQIAVTVERGTQSVEVPLALTLRRPPAIIETLREPGLPTLYTVKLSGASIQVYLDPEQPGPSAVHLTFLDPMGNELPIPALPSVTVTPQGGGSIALTVMRFGVGHFAAQGTLPAGLLSLEIAAQPAVGELLSVSLPIRL